MGRRSLISSALIAGAAMHAVVRVAAPASADPVADFYKGKTFTILVGQEPGTGYDIVGRTVARHIGRHIPGQPQIIVQNMPGGSGIAAANWLFGVGPKDGTVIATFTPNVIVEPLLGNPAAKYTPAAMAWIGNVEQGASVCGVRSDAGVASFEDLRTKEIAVGATGATGPLGQAPRVLNTITGTRLKIIYGYKGAASVKIAFQKGEVQGICGITWSFVKALWKDELDAGRFKAVIQLAGPRQPDLAAAAVPHLDDIVRLDELRYISMLTFGSMVLGRAYAISADVPPARADALRRAFSQTVADAAFLADAARTGLEIAPASGEEVAAQVKRFYAIPPDMLEKVKKVVSGGG